MKNILLTILLSFSLNLAAEERDCLLMHFKDGSKAIFLLKDSPKIMFEDGVVSIDTKQYQFTNIRKYTLENSDQISSAIELLEGNSKDFRIENGVLYFAKNGGNSKISIYTVDGKELPMNSTRNKNGINLSVYGSGVYLLKAGNETIKISVR